MAAPQNMENSKLRNNSKAKKTGHRRPHPKAAVRPNEPGNPNAVCNFNAPMWYYYDSIGNICNSFPPSSPQEQQQVFMPPGPSMPNNYSYMPQQQYPQLYYYPQSQPRTQMNIFGMNLVQGERESPRQLGYDYQLQRPQRNYYNFTYIPPRTSALSNDIDKLNSDILPQSFCQDSECKGAHLQMKGTPQSKARQAPHSTSNARSSGGSPQNGFTGGKITRLNSITSLNNMSMQSSEKALAEYCRITERNLSKKGKKEKKVVTTDDKHTQSVKHSKPVKQTVTIEEVTLPNQPQDIQNLVISEALDTRGSSFFRKLGLCVVRKQPKRSTKRATYKKLSFLKRLFGVPSLGLPVTTTTIPAEVVCEPKKNTETKLKESPKKKV